MRLLRDSALRLLRSPHAWLQGSWRYKLKYIRGPLLWLKSTLNGHVWSLWNLNKGFYSYTFGFITRPCFPESALDFVCALMQFVLNFSIAVQKKRLKIFKAIKSWLLFVNSLALVYLFPFTFSRSRKKPDGNVAMSKFFANLLSLINQFTRPILYCR